MSRLFSIALVLAMGLVFQTGCGDTTTTKTETTKTTPDGKTTVTNEKTVEKSGDNPPPVSNP